MHDDRLPISDSAAAWLAGGGEMGDRIRGLDWTGTPAGPPATWPQSLRSAVSILLPSKAQICLFWGRDLVKLYNDAYIPVLDRKHPWALGRPAREVWREIWDVLGPLLEGVVATGEAFRARDHLFYLERRGFAEETYFDVSYDPVRDESGKVGGVFCIVSETTGRVLSERRVRTLRDLGRAKEGRSVSEACELAIAALGSNPKDLPFVSLYLVDGAAARAAGVVGVTAGGALHPPSIALDDACWSLGEVMRSGRALVLDTLPAAAGAELPPDAAPRATLVQPVLRGGECVAFMITGTSRFLALEGDYRDFLELVATQVGTALTQASSYEEERKRAEALAELDRAKTTFFSNVSHEFRTPLTLMLGPLEDLLARPPDAWRAEDHEVLAVVHRSGRRLLKLVNTLLDFSRIQAGRHRATYEPTDLGALTAELAAVFRSAIEQAGLRLDVQAPAGLEPVYVDREMWEKIVLNLLSNAFKFTFEGTITVALADRRAGVELLVRDTGIGIPGAELDRIFDRFHRVENVRARTHEGSGIGLALVQELVRLHGGKVRVESAPDQGTAFTIALPRGADHLPVDQVATASAAIAPSGLAGLFVEEALGWVPDDAEGDGPEPASGRDAPAAGDGPRVLVADDNADMREYVVRLLRARWAVEAVGDGGAALAALRTRRPDLVLADVMMPGLGGFELLAAVRADPATRDIPVILLSARAGEEARVEGLQAGADDYVTKPFSARELLARAAALLKLSHVRRAHEKELGRLNAELSEKVRDLEAYASSVAHDLRSPLRSIQTLSGFLEEEFGHELPPAASDYLHRITGSVKRMEALIESLLEYSRLTRSEIELAPVVAADVAKEVLETLSDDLQQRNGHITIDLDDVVVRADRVMLSQVFRNLISNALKFTRPGANPDVHVGSRSEGDTTRLWVQDHGIGIEPGDRSRLSEAFFQLNSTKDYPGSGLGLAIVRRATERMGGTWGFDSVVDGGSRFWIDLARG
jgi:signal transduction histidine kinase